MKDWQKDLLIGGGIIGLIVGAVTFFHYNVENIAPNGDTIVVAVIDADSSIETPIAGTTIEKIRVELQKKRILIWTDASRYPSRVPTETGQKFEFRYKAGATRSVTECAGIDANCTLDGDIAKIDVSHGRILITSTTGDAKELASNNAILEVSFR